MTRHLESEHKIDCKKMKIEKKRESTSKQKLLTDYDIGTDSSQSQSKTVSSQQSSQSQELEEAKEVRRKRDLKPVKAMLRYCYTEFFDISVINKPTTKILINQLRCLHNNSDICEKTVFEELCSMASSMEKEIEKCLENVKTISVSTAKYTIVDDERKILIHTSFVDENWKYKSFFLSMGTEETETADKYPGKLVRSVLNKFGIELGDTSIYAISCHKILNVRSFEKRKFGHEVNEILHSNFVQDGLLGLYDRMKYSLRTIYFSAVNDSASSKQKLAETARELRM